MSDDPEETVIPDAVLSDPELSLMAKGIYALALSHQSQPINPYDETVESTEVIGVAIEQLVEAGLVKRMTEPS